MTNGAPVVEIPGVGEVVLRPKDVVLYQSNFIA